MTVQCPGCETIFQMVMSICSHCGRVIPKNQTEKLKIIKRAKELKANSKHHTPQKEDELSNDRSSVRLSSMGEKDYKTIGDIMRERKIDRSSQCL